MDVITNNNIKCTVALSALSDVLDPEIGLNVVDLGLIYQMDFDEDDKTIETGMTLTTPFCPMCACNDKYAIELSGNQERLKLNTSSKPKKVVANNHIEAVAINQACTSCRLLS